MMEQKKEPEFKPIFRLPEGDHIEGTWENAHLFLHLPEYQELNHITLKREKMGMMMSYLIFRHVMEDFDIVAEGMLENIYPCTSRPIPLPSTETAFREKFVGDVTTFPLAWDYTEEDKFYGI